jgi:Flp pilus assembly protein TadB
VRLALVTVAAITGWAGGVLVLGERRWFRRAPLRERLAPYLPGARGTGVAPPGSAAILVALAASLAKQLGSRLGAAVGVKEDLAVRLERVHSTWDAGVWRLRQIASSSAALVVASMVVVALRAPPALAALFLGGAPVLVFLLHEHQISTASARWQRRLVLELPVVSEQLGMLLSAGYSVGAAIDRVSRRANGACAADLDRVCTRVRHGIGEHTALIEWAELSDVAAVHRLVAVLALDREASDLGRLITEEARALRREAHRELVEAIERRSQQVWIPVTVATLVPGVLFLAVPFVAALQLFTGS